MTAGFKDHFSGAAEGYAEARPQYPDALIDRLAADLPPGAVAWDCGCGSGQLSVGLARRVGRVVATDASGAQIAQAAAHPQISYRVASAEASGLPAASVDLVVAAQAAHWFDLPAFYREIRRVAKPGGRVALVGYGPQHLPDAPAVDAALRAFYGETVGPYWPPERALVETGYADLDFPFADRPTEWLAIRQDWTLDRLLRFIATWSAVSAYRAATGGDPLPLLAQQLAALWGPVERPRRVVWPLFLRLGRSEGRSEDAIPDSEN